jgi:hypothetical protein
MKKQFLGVVVVASMLASSAWAGDLVGFGAVGEELRWFIAHTSSLRAVLGRD